jgi:predicted HicB family RNase H-like nuclease
MAKAKAIVTLNFRLDANLHQRLQKVAEQNGTSLQKEMVARLERSLVMDVAERGMDKTTETHRQIVEALQGAMSLWNYVKHHLSPEMKRALVERGIEDEELVKEVRGTDTALTRTESDVRSQPRKAAK